MKKSIFNRLYEGEDHSVKFLMAVFNNPTKEMALGFSLHIRAEEAIGKFQQEIEDDFKYLYEILSEAKQSFGR